MVEGKDNRKSITHRQERRRESFTQIHLAKSGGDNLTDGSDFRVLLAQEFYLNSLFSYAHREREHLWKQYWDRLIAIDKSRTDRT